MKYLVALLLALWAGTAVADPLEILAAPDVIWTPEYLSDEHAAVVEKWVKMALADPDNAQFERMAASKSDRGLFLVCGTITIHGRDGVWRYAGLLNVAPPGSDLAYFKPLAFGEDHRTDRNIRLLCAEALAQI
jgi:hypothetical protein